jgi:hypothetical protein
MSNLTLDKMLEILRKFPPPPPSPFDLPFRFGGLKVFEAPSPPPKIQVRDIKLSDGTSILTPEFRAQMNAWLIEMFGFQDDPFKDKAYILGNYGLVISKPNLRIINDALG